MQKPQKPERKVNKTAELIKEQQKAQNKREKSTNDDADEESEMSIGDIKRLCVLFNDAPIADYMASKLPKVLGQKLCT